MLEWEPSNAPPLGLLPLHRVGTALLPPSCHKLPVLAEAQRTVIASLHLFAPSPIPQFQILLCVGIP